MSRPSILLALASCLLLGACSGATPFAVSEDAGSRGASSGGGAGSGGVGSGGSGGGSSSGGGGSGGSSGNAGTGSGGSGGGSSSGVAGSSSGATGSGSGGSGSGAGGGAGPTLLIEPDQGLTPIYDLISSATKTLDMTMYELVDTTVTGLLTKAAKSGVAVRVILDQNLEKSSNTTAYNALGAGGVQVHWANPTYSATHQKTITVDGTTSAIMTLNLVSSDYSTSRDFAVITTDAADVAAIETVFDADFTNAATTPPTGDDLVWSPTNAQTSMVDLIGGAKGTLIVENEEMSDSAIVSALASAASRGVSVEVVMTASSSYDSELTTLKTAGAKVVTYAANASLYIHAKVIVADYGTSNARALLGSENFSSASLTKNRELGLVTADPTILASTNTTLANDFKGGTAY
jgi:cardiolipin synthase